MTLRASAPLAGALLGLSGQTVARLLGFAFYAAFARTLGPASFGRIGIAAGLGYLGLALVEPGLNLLLVRDAAANPDTLPCRLQAVFSYKITVAVGAWIVMTGLALAGWFGADMGLVVAFAGGATLLSFVEDLAATAFVVLRRFDLDSLLRLGFRVVSMSLGFASLFLSQREGPVFVGLGLGAAAASFGAAWFLRRQGLPLALRFNPGAVARGAARQWPLLVGAACWLACLRMDQVLAGLLGVAHSEIGTYNAAFKVVDALTVVPGTISTAFYPEIVRRLGAHGLGDARGADDVAEAALLSSLVVTVPISIGGAILAPRLIPLVYGDGFTDAAALLGPLLAILPLCGLQLSLGHIALTRRRPAVYGGALATNLTIHLVSAVLLVPAFSTRGAVAAALLGHTAGVIAFRAGLGGPRPIRLRWALTPMLAAVPMAFVTVWTAAAPLMITVVAAGAVYLAGAGLLGTPRRLLPYLIQRQG